MRHLPLVWLGFALAGGARLGPGKQEKSQSFGYRMQQQLEGIPAKLNQQAAATVTEMDFMQEGMEQLQRALNNGDDVMSLSTQLAQKAASVSGSLDELVNGLQELDASLAEVVQEDSSLEFQPTLFEIKSTMVPGMRSSFTFFQMGLRQMRFLFEQLEDGASDDVVKRAKDTLHYEVDNLQQMKAELVQKIQKLLRSLKQLHEELRTHFGHVAPQAPSLATEWAAVEGMEISEALAAVHEKQPSDAVGSKLTTLLEFLRGQNFDKASTEAEWKSRKPLHLAAAKGRPQEAELLLEVRADVDAQVPNTGDTPLLYAAVQLSRHQDDEETQDFQSVVALLLAHGADKAKANKKHKLLWRTPLRICYANLWPIVVTPILVVLMPKGYHKWINQIINLTLKAIAVHMAWKLQEVIRAVRSGLLGASLVGTGVITLTFQGFSWASGGRCCKRKFDPDKSYLDELVGLPLAAFGIWFQLKCLPYHFWFLPVRHVTLSAKSVLARATISASFPLQLNAARRRSSNRENCI